MKNKILVQLIVPEIDEKFDLFIPINKKIGNVINLLNKSIYELSNGVYSGSKYTSLYNKVTGEKYEINILVRESSINQGTVLILM